MFSVQNLLMVVFIKSHYRNTSLKNDLILFQAHTTWNTKDIFKKIHAAVTL